MSAAVCAGLLMVAAGVAWSRAVAHAQRDGVVAQLTGAASNARTRDVPGIARRAIRRAVALPVVLLGFTSMGVAGAAIAAAGCVALPRVLARRRRRAITAKQERQLVGAVVAVASALRAGLSLPQAVRFAASESAEPLASELSAVSARVDMGVPLERSLQGWADGTSNEDVRLFVNVLTLRLGAGLPEVLDRVGETLRARGATRREVAGLTAQARLSGAVLGLLPIGFFLLLSLISRGDMMQAYSTAAGVTAIVMGLVLQAAAFAWIRRLVAAEPV